MGKYIPPTPAEIHAIGWGFLDAHNSNNETFEEAINDAKKDTSDVRNEPHYYRLGYAIRNQWRVSTPIISFLMSIMAYLVNQLGGII